MKRLKCVPTEWDELDKTDARVKEGDRRLCMPWFPKWVARKLADLADSRGRAPLDVLVASLELFEHHTPPADTVETITVARLGTINLAVAQDVARKVSARYAKDAAEARRGELLASLDMANKARQKTRKKD